MKKTPNYGLWVLILLFGYMAALILGAYWQFLLFALLFAVLFFPLYNKIERRMPRVLAATAIVLLVLLALVVPTLYVVGSTIQQAQPAYEATVKLLDTPSVRESLGFTGDQLRELAIAAGDKLRKNVLDNASSYLAQASELLIGMFIMFITLFFFLLDGKRFVMIALDEAPIQRIRAEQFLIQMRKIIRAVILGQLATAVVQGILAGVLLWVFGIPNALFWGVIVALLSIIPVLGPFLVYIPASGYLLLQERYVAGIAMLVIGIVVLSQVDNIIRPYVANRTAKVHPLIVILGVIGGLKLWGLIGFILGPLVLAAFFALYDFFASNDGEKA